MLERVFYSIVKILSIDAFDEMIILEKKINNISNNRT